VLQPPSFVAGRKGKRKQGVGRLRVKMSSAGLEPWRFLRMQVYGKTGRKERGYSVRSKETTGRGRKKIS